MAAIRIALGMLAQALLWAVFLLLCIVGIAVAALLAALIAMGALLVAVSASIEQLKKAGERAAATDVLVGSPPPKTPSSSRPKTQPQPIEPNMVPR